jgi:hypothetical protein
MIVSPFVCGVFSVLDWRWEAGAWREAKPGRVAPWAATFHFVAMGLLEGPTDSKETWPEHLVSFLSIMFSAIRKQTRVELFTGQDLRAKN